MANPTNKIQKLCDDFGFDSEFELLEHSTFDSIVPCICMNDDCDHTDELEPDCRDGYCPECKTNTLQSALVIRGMI